jgi:hypothetical protein
MAAEKTFIADTLSFIVAHNFRAGLFIKGAMSWTFF